MLVKQNKGVFPFREMPPHAITFWRDFGNQRMGLMPPTDFVSKKVKGCLVSEYSSVPIVPYMSLRPCYPHFNMLISKHWRSEWYGAFITLFFHMPPNRTMRNGNILCRLHLGHKLPCWNSSVSVHILSNWARHALCNLRSASISFSVFNGFCISKFFKIIFDSTNGDVSFLMYLLWRLSTAKPVMENCLPLGLQSRVNHSFKVAGRRLTKLYKIFTLKNVYLDNN